jgi:small subunit ribosomal protein S20
VAASRAAILPAGSATIARPATAGASSNGEHQENLRYRSTIKTLTKRLETAVSEGDAERVATEHRELVRMIDRATTRGALHKNTAARKKSRAARLAAS